MKKTKKLVAVLCMMASLSANLILPIGASASMPTLSEVDFDNITINQTALNNATDHNARNNSIPGIVMSGHNYQTNSETGKIWATELISLAHAPDVTVPTDDRALKIKLNPNTYTATPKFRIDGDIAGKKVVYDFNIMYDGISTAHTLSFQLYNANGTTDAEKYLDRSITQIYGDKISDIMQMHCISFLHLNLPEGKTAMAEITNMSFIPQEHLLIWVN